jgi:pyridoxamine 5'-phosphate oxidase
MGGVQLRRQAASLPHKEEPSCFWQSTWERTTQLHWKLTRNPDPIRQFQRWLKLAMKAGLKEPTAMTLATATRAGKPSARMVLLKGVDKRGFVFYTNYESRKGGELHENPRAALVWYWSALDRQVRVTGRVSKVTAAESDEYFGSRPLGSRFSAAVSAQSSVVKSRAALLADLRRLKARYPETGPPRPKHWGGYRVDPDEIEFWQQGEYRLHDRLRYRRGRDGTWRVDRLAP